MNQALTSNHYYNPLNQDSVERSSETGQNMFKSPNYIVLSKVTNTNINYDQSDTEDEFGNDVAEVNMKRTNIRDTKLKSDEKLNDWFLKEYPEIE